MAIDVPLVLARWVHFLCLAVVFGASLFPLYASRAPAKGESLRALAAGQRALGLAAFLALVSAVAWVASSLATMVGGFDGIFDRDAIAGFFFETTFGPIWLLRLAMLLALVFVVTRASRARISFCAFLSGAALASQA